MKEDEDMSRRKQMRQMKIIYSSLYFFQLIVTIRYDDPGETDYFGGNFFQNGNNFISSVQGCSGKTQPNWFNPPWNTWDVGFTGFLVRNSDDLWNFLSCLLMKIIKIMKNFEKTPLRSTEKLPIWPFRNPI